MPIRPFRALKFSPDVFVPPLDLGLANRTSKASVLTCTPLSGERHLGGASLRVMNSYNPKNPPPGLLEFLATNAVPRRSAVFWFPKSILFTPPRRGHKTGSSTFYLISNKVFLDPVYLALCSFPYRFHLYGLRDEVVTHTLLLCVSLFFTYCSTNFKVLFGWPLSLFSVPFSVLPFPFPSGFFDCCCIDLFPFWGMHLFRVFVFRQLPALLWVSGAVFPRCRRWYPSCLYIGRCSVELILTAFVSSCAHRCPCRSCSARAASGT